MSDYDVFFETHVVKCKIGKKNIKVSSIDVAQRLLLEYIAKNSISKSSFDDDGKTGTLSVGKEKIAMFSYDGRLWSFENGDEIIWK